MKNRTTLKKTLKGLTYSLGIASLLISSSAHSQVTESDWDLSKKSANRGLITTAATDYVNTQISLSDFYSKIENTEQEITLPNPDRGFDTFIIKPSQTIAAEVAHLYTIKTFTGHKLDDPTTLIACDIDELGFHAAVYAPEHSYFIEPQTDSGDHIIFYKKKMTNAPVQCNIEEHDHDTHHRSSQSHGTTQKRNYRLAIAASGEFSEQFGGNPYNVNNVVNAIASGVNMIRPIFLRDLGVSFTLIPNTDIIYPNKDTDPFDDSNVDIDNVHSIITNAVGLANYDIGHMVMWARTGGTAYKGVVCNNRYKGGGFSGSSHTETTLWVDYASHEIGHQFGSEHNFSSEECGTSASGFRYEPGEGSSIMSYANVCSNSARYASASDPYFHYASIKQMHDYMDTTSCATTDSSGNTGAPVPNAKLDITIPKQTPFILVGSASDPNDPTNQLTYGWQQYDGSALASSGSPSCTSTNNSLFMYRPPTSDNFRSFPAWSDVLAGNNNDMDWEKLPCVARDINFSMAVRDNNTTFGRVVDDKMKVSVANTGPFQITGPSPFQSVTGGSEQTITWDVNGTDSHCPKVDILISTDGGETYTILANGTNNDGEENFTVPNIATTKARLLIQCDIDGGFKSASTFYDVTGADMTINENPTLGVDDFNESSLNIYPNPVDTILNIEIGDSNSYKMSLTNINGVTLLQNTINGSGTIDISSLASGLYLLEVVQTTTGNRFVKKIIVK